MFCQEQVVQLHRERAAIEAAGARVVVVGNGPPLFIAGLRERTGYEGEVFTDPELRAYRALRLRKDLRSSMNLRTARRVVEAMRAGFRQRSTQGNPWQQGGVFAFDRGGAPLYAHPSQYAGDHPSFADVVSALERR